MKIDETIIAFDVEATSNEELISLLADKLCAAGYVDETYGQATITRETIHPTGLPTKPFPIAIPHADADGVITSALAFASMKRPVMFCNMVEPEEELPVELVFMIANNTPEEQVKVLRKLATLFGDPEKLVELKALAHSKSIMDWFEVELAHES
ncbi:MAG: PTS sugar transporter subunit IIA [Anaerolineaceae bacterium]|jgi:PTS system galactitol-specific IIA component|nr:PTS sugar transporter subunit IIA [Anaerolineaceae bacterium]